MKILEINELAIKGIYVLKIQKFSDERGYFIEKINNSIFLDKTLPDSLNNFDIKQINESFSFANTFRGLHFQTEPQQAKLIRCISGHLIDYAMDIRIDSPTYGKIIAYEMYADMGKNYFEMIFLPKGMAHGIFLPKDSIIEYYCDEYWNIETDKSISIFAENIDWGLCQIDFKDKLFTAFNSKKLIISNKDNIL